MIVIVALQKPNRWWLQLHEYTKRNPALIKPAHPLHNYLHFVLVRRRKMANTLHWKLLQLFKHCFIKETGDVKRINQFCPSQEQKNLNYANRTINIPSAQLNVRSILWENMSNMQEKFEYSTLSLLIPTSFKTQFLVSWHEYKVHLNPKCIFG